MGKSSLLARVSAAKPEIAAYPFTTITPVLGVVSLGDERSFVLADIPGLIEGAHEGKGLGHEFLRHIERTKVLIHIVDLAGVDGRDPVDDYHKINEELSQYNEKLSKRPQIVAGNKPKKLQTAKPSKYPQGYFKAKKCKHCGSIFIPPS